MKPTHLTLLLVLSLSTGCLRQLATGALADALSSGTGATLSGDDDPELVRDAAPFGLKTMEALLPDQPRHVGLLTGLCSGFAQYGYAFVGLEGERADFEGRSSDARLHRARAKKLLLRARDYGLRGLEVRVPGVSEVLKSTRNMEAALATLGKDDVPLLYWTAASWALAISSGREDLGLVAELPAPGALAARALELDPTWGEGALHEFFVTYESARPGGTQAKARAHYEAALSLSRGTHLGLFNAWAEGWLLPAQQKEAFEAELARTLAGDPDASPSSRLANTLAQRRARLLLKYVNDLFN